MGYDVKRNILGVLKPKEKIKLHRRVDEWIEDMKKKKKEKVYDKNKTIK